MIFLNNKYINFLLKPPSLRVRVSSGHLCKAEAPTEAEAETVDFAKQKTEGENNKRVQPKPLFSPSVSLTLNSR